MSEAIKTTAVPEGLTSEIINEVQDHITSQLKDSAELLLITTIANVRKGAKEPKFLTVLEARDKLTGLKSSASFNTLAIFRQIKRDARLENV